MRYCKRKRGNVSDHQCKPVKHPECAKARIPRFRKGRKGFCHYAEDYIVCDHGYCRDKQGENLMKLISGLYHIAPNGHLLKLGKNHNIGNPKPRTADGLRRELRVNRMTKADTVDKRRNWKTYKSTAEFMRAGRGGIT